MKTDEISAMKENAKKVEQGLRTYQAVQAYLKGTNPGFK